MKVLTVKNPWADWIIFGCEGSFKTTENRTWETFYRGRLYIHVSKQLEDNPYFWTYIRTDGKERHEYWKNQSGKIIGSVELYGIDREIKTEWDEPGLFHWRMRDPRPLDVAIETRGALGLWNYEVRNG